MDKRDKGSSQIKSYFAASVVRLLKIESGCLTLNVDRQNDAASTSLTQKSSADAFFSVVVAAVVNFVVNDFSGEDVFQENFHEDGFVRVLKLFIRT